MRRLTLRLAVLIATSAPFTGSLAAGPADDREQPSASALVEAIIAEESKVEALQSLYLRFEGRWTRTPESIARELGELKNARSRS